MQREYSRYTKRFFQDDLLKEIGTRVSPLFGEIVPSNDREWLLTNGLGGYASTTLTGNLRRKFHGLLIASLSAPVKRWVFVSNIEDEVYINGIPQRFENQMFELLPLPKFTCDFGKIIIEKSFVMPYRENTLIIRYRSLDKSDFKMRIKPVVNSRHFYDLNGGGVNFGADIEDGKISLKPDNIDKRLNIICNFAEFKRNFVWRELRYDIDKERGEGWIDHGLEIGEIELESEKGEAYVVFTVEDKSYNPELEMKREIDRRRSIIDTSGLPSEMAPLLLTADSFIVERNSHATIIAGYHWFADWGRDSLISLPGLLLVTGRFGDARSLLLNLSRYMYKGLVPNAFTEKENAPIYNSVDASLWFVDRVYQYLKYTNDMELLKEIWPKLVSMVEYFEKGTLFDIKVDEDGLLYHGPGLTWMDVKIGDEYITPRAGKAVEIQALWYNALRIMEKLSFLLGDERNEHYHDLAEGARKSFHEKYREFCDVLDGDFSLRPNMIFLPSLDFIMIGHDLSRRIVEVIEKELLTPYGLRTLSRNDPRYKPSLIGDYNKDIAYHNGCVWPWLLGFFVRAYLKVKGYSKENRLFALRRFVLPLMGNLTEGCVGSINEIFDGDYPHLPRGCISQAWSVGELLRCIVEDILYIRPKYEDLFRSC